MRRTSLVLRQRRPIGEQFLAVAGPDQRRAGDGLADGDNQAGMLLVNRLGQFPGACSVGQSWTTCRLAAAALRRSPAACAACASARFAAASALRRVSHFTVSG